MGDASRFAVGIAVLVGAMIFFFFAFHPGGVTGIKNPGDMLQWLINEFNSAGQNVNAPTSTNNATTPNNVGSAPTATGA